MKSVLYPLLDFFFFITLDFITSSTTENFDVLSSFKLESSKNM